MKKSILIIAAIIALVLLFWFFFSSDKTPKLKTQSVEKSTDRISSNEANINLSIEKKPAINSKQRDQAVVTEPLSEANKKPDRISIPPPPQATIQNISVNKANSSTITANKEALNTDSESEKNKEETFLPSGQGLSIDHPPYDSSSPPMDNLKPGEQFSPPDEGVSPFGEYTPPK